MSYKDYIPPFRSPRISLLPDIIPTTHEPLLTRLFTPSVTERDKRKSHELYQDAKNRYEQSKLTDETIESFIIDIASNCAAQIAEVKHLDQLSDDVLHAILKTVRAFKEAEPTLFEKPEPFTDGSVEQAAHYRNHLRKLIHNFQNHKHLTERWSYFVICLIGEAIAELPNQPDPADEDILLSTSPVHSFLPETIYEELVGYVSCEEVTQTGVMEPIYEGLLHNIIEANGYTFEDYLQRKSQPKLKIPPDPSIFNGTPFQALLEAPISVHLPRKKRFEHHWIVGGTGHGKTQCLQSLILNDIVEVAKNNATIVVIDSQGELIDKISRLEIFAPGHQLHGKLTLIEPKDIEYPVALNLFDVNMERVNSYSPLIREQTINGIIELYDFVFSSLLDAEMTSKQATLFRYITRFMMSIPDANIQTLRQLMEKDGYDRFKEHINKLTGTTRAFFETEFDSREFSATKEQVLRRLWGILENQTFERMFSHPRNKLDMFTEMNEGRVILISTSKDLLKESGTKVFGRFFIAMIAQSALERAAIPEQERMPTFIYVDECHEYVDSNVTQILEQARKQKIGMVLAHQYLAQIDSKLLQSFSSNTSIKFTGGVSAKDARQLAPDMRTKPEFIDDVPTGTFAAFIKGITPAAAPHEVTFGLMEGLDRMSDEDFAIIRSEMREKYAVPYNEVQEIISRHLPERHDNEDETTTDVANEPEEIKPTNYNPPKITPTDPKEFED